MIFLSISQLFLIILAMMSLYLLLAIRQDQVTRAAVRMSGRPSRWREARIGSRLDDRRTYHELPTPVYKKVWGKMLGDGRVPIMLQQDDEQTRVIFEKGIPNGLALVGA